MSNPLDSLVSLLEAERTPEEKPAFLKSEQFSALYRELTEGGGLSSLPSDSSEDAAHKREKLNYVIKWMLSLEEVPDDECEMYCGFGLLASAAVESGDAWLLFKRLQIQFLIEQARMGEAIPEMLELAELLPEDAEVQAMVKKYQGHSAGRKKATKTESEASAALSRECCVPTGCDREFYELIQQLKSDSLEQLLSNAATEANRWVEEDHEYYGLLLKWYRSWYRVGLFGQNKGFIDYFGGMYQYLKQNTAGLIQLYEQLADYRSKATLKTMLQHWMTFHPDLRKSGRETLFEHYFDLDVIKCDKNEVFVDCGSYDGETIKAFIRNYGSEYKSIYSYELTPSSFEMVKENLRGLPRLHLRNAGVSDKNGRFPFWVSPEAAGQPGNRLMPTGNAMAEVVRIDDDIQEDITFIKMDVEGAECEALRGAERQIRRNQPKLAISLYHKLPDLLDIPRLVKSYVPAYKLYLRHEGIESCQFPFPTEYVLLATL